MLRGVNLPAAAYDKTPPYPYGVNYVVPGFDTQGKWSPAMVDYYMSKGFNCFPIQIQWEIAQPSLMGPLETAGYLNKVEILANYILDKGGTPIITPHFKMQYNGKTATPEQYVHFIGKLAMRFPFHQLELMSEPATVSVQDWVDKYAIPALNVLRFYNSKTVYIGAGGYSGARSFFETWYGEKSSTALLRIKDPGTVISIHHYLDSNWSGAYPDNEVAQSPDASYLAIADLTTWASTNKRKLFLGEFGVPATDQGNLRIRDLLAHLERNQSVWTGWAWWCGGPWNEGYKLSLEPVKSQYNVSPDKPQMKFLEPYLKEPVPEPTETEKMAKYVNDRLDAIKAGLADGSWKK